MDEISTCSWNIEHNGFARLLPDRGYYCIRQQFNNKFITNLLQERIKLWVANINLRDFQMRIATSLTLIKM